MIKTCFQYSVSMSGLSEKLVAQIHPAVIHKGFAVILVPRWPLKHGGLLCLGIRGVLYAPEVALKLLGAQTASCPDEHPVKHSSISNEEGGMGSAGLSERDLDRVDTMRRRLFCSLTFPSRRTFRCRRGKSL